MSSLYAILSHILRGALEALALQLRNEIGILNVRAGHADGVVLRVEVL